MLVRRLGSLGSISDGVPARVKGLIFSLAFTSLAVGYLIVYITGYMPEIGYSSGSIGLLIGVFGLVPILTGIPFGVLSDRKGRKTLLLLGSFGISPGLFIFALTNSISYFLVSAVLLGLSEAASLTTWNAIIADQTDMASRNRAFSLSFVVSTVFTGLGSAVPFSFPFLERSLHLDSIAVHQDFMFVFSFLSLATPVLLWSLLRGYCEVISPRSVEKITAEEESQSIVEIFWNKRSHRTGCRIHNSIDSDMVLSEIRNNGCLQRTVTSCFEHHNRPVSYR